MTGLVGKENDRKIVLKENNRQNSIETEIDVYIQPTLQNILNVSKNLKKLIWFSKKKIILFTNIVYWIQKVEIFIKIQSL